MARSSKKHKRIKNAIYALLETKLNAQKKVKTVSRPNTSMTESEQAIHQRHLNLSNTY